MRNPNVKLLSSFLIDDVLGIIDSFFPYKKKKKSPQVSPSLQKELKKIQTMRLKNKPSSYMKGLEDFCLD